MLSIRYFYIFLTSALTCIILVPYVAKLSVKVGGIDIPDARKIHLFSIPRLGGIAIFTSFLFTFVLFATEISQQLKGLLSGAMIIFLTGLADDITSLTPRQKLICEFIAVGLVVFMGKLCVTDLGNPFGLGTLKLGLFAEPFTIIGIVGVINAINLLDGLDGLAGGVCSIATVTFAILAYPSGNTLLFSLSIILLGSLIGFLFYNNYPARIFMGDGGSLLLGYFMGCFSVMLTEVEVPPISPYIPLLILGIPILDTVTVMINRKRNGNSVFLPDKTHLHHRLMGLGIGHKFTVLIVFGLSYLLSFVSIFFLFAGDSVLLLLVGLSYSLIYGLLYFATSKGTCIPDLSSNQSPRSMVSHRTLIHYSGYLVVTAEFLVIGIMILPLFLSQGSIKAISFFPLVILAMSIWAYLTKPSWHNNTYQTYIYSAGFFMIFIMVNFGKNDLLLGLPLTSYSYGLFLLLMICAGIKIVIREKASRLLVSPLEYLVLLIVLSTLLMPASLTDSYHLMAVAAKSIIFFYGFRIILSKKIKQNRYIILVMILTSFGLSARFLLGI